MRAAAIGGVSALQQDIADALAGFESTAARERHVLRETAALSAELDAIRSSEVGRITEGYRNVRSALRRLTTPILGRTLQVDSPGTETVEAAKCSGPEPLGAGASNEGCRRFRCSC